MLSKNEWVFLAFFQLKIYTLIMPYTFNNKPIFYKIVWILVFLVYFYVAFAKCFVNDWVWCFFIDWS